MDKEKREHVEWLCQQLTEIKFQHRNAEKAVFRLHNQGGSMIRRRLGWSIDLPKKDAETICRKAERIFGAVGSGKPLKNEDEQMILDEMVLYLYVYHEASKPLVAQVKLIKQAAEKLVVQLPIWEVVNRVRGIGTWNIALIVGEAGAPLSSYGSHSKLWKRFGLAVMDTPDGKRTRQRKIFGTDDAAKQQAILHGYNPQRRSSMYRVGSCMFKSNQYLGHLVLDTNGEKQRDENGKLIREPSVPHVWRQFFLDRKKWEEEKVPEGPKALWQNRAQRYMEKRLLRQLRTLWIESERDRWNPDVLELSPNDMGVKCFH